MQREQLQSFCGYLREIIKETRGRKRENSHSTLAFARSFHPPPVTVHCAIKIYDANKQRRYHAKSAFHEWICSCDARQLLMDVNHRRINNLSNVSIRICIFPAARFARAIFHGQFTLDEVLDGLENYLLHFLSFDQTTNPFEDRLESHAASDWMMKWSGSVGETQTDAAAFFAVARRLKSIKT